MVNVESKKWLASVILILLLADLAIVLNIPFLRQIFGFLFLTILPGLLILHVLKLNKLDFLEKFILTWGLSISFLIFFGLLINTLSLGIGYEMPLSTIPLLISFNLAFIILAAIGDKANKESFSLPNVNLNTPEKAFLIVPILFPALSIFGMHVMNTSDNNIILMLLLFLIPIYVIFVCIFNHKFSKRLYPVMIFLISISLLLLLSLRSNHIIGIDAHAEYYFFRVTLSNLHWSILGHSSLDACLNISLLPTIYQSILNIPSEFLFKILYSLIFSASPLIIYVISKKYVGELYAFLASCFFMFQMNFLWTEYNARTNIAILFVALSMMILFNDKIDPVKKRILFIIFMASCIVSHYSTTYVFFLTIFGAFMGIELLSKKYTIKKVISLTTIVLFFSVIFFWYSQITEGAFNSGVGYFAKTFTNLNNFFVEEARRETTNQLFGKGVTQEVIPDKIQFIFRWLTFAFTAIGVITMIRQRYKEMSFPEHNFKKPDFLKEKFEVGYLVIALVFSGLLVAIVALPYASTNYNLDRLYGVVIIVLAVFFVIGGIMLSKHFFFFTKRKPVLKEKQKSSTKNTSQVWACLIILLVLVPYSLCVTGVMHQVFGYNREITLNSRGEQDYLNIYDQDIIAARWIGDHNTKNKKKMNIYSDVFGGRRVALAYDVNKCPRVDSSFFEDNKTVIDGYIYLRYTNVVAGKVCPVGRETVNITDYSHLFIGTNEIYDNGGSEVYYRSEEYEHVG